MGSAASLVESVRLNPMLKRDLLLRAAEEQTSMSEAIRRAIGQYLRATSEPVGVTVGILADGHHDYRRETKRWMPGPHRHSQVSGRGSRRRGA